MTYTAETNVHLRDGREQPDNAEAKPEDLDRIERPFELLLVPEGCQCCIVARKTVSVGGIALMFGNCGDMNRRWCRMFFPGENRHRHEYRATVLVGTKSPSYLKLVKLWWSGLEVNRLIDHSHDEARSAHKRIVEIALHIALAYVVHLTLRRRTVPR